VGARDPALPQAGSCLHRCSRRRSPSTEPARTDRQARRKAIDLAPHSSGSTRSYGRILDAIDSFIPDGARLEDEDLLFRARILVTINIFFILTVLGLWLVEELIIDMPGMGMDPTLTRILLGGVSTGLAGSLIFFRLTGSIERAATGTAAAIYITLVAAVGLQGGFASTPSLAVYLLLPLVAGLFSGRAASLVWSGIVIATYCGFYALHRHGHALPGALPPETRDANILLNLVIACIGIGTVVTIYQSLNLRLRRALADERLQLSHQAGHDPLTNLANRRRFDETLMAALGRANRSESHLAILVIDLNGFKPVNDLFGHRAGDAVLTTIAKRLCGVTRGSDAIARMGGDEFAILMELVSSRAGVETFLNTIHATLDSPHEIEGESVHVGAAIGVAMYPDDARDVDSLLRLADDAMYLAKSEGSLFHFAADTKDDESRND
jgi:diguanylate cyclase (GGDEF)-like protein